MVTAPSGRISIQALGLNGSRAAAACVALGSNAGRYSPITRLAPAAAPVLRNSRRLTMAWLMSHLWNARSAEPTTGVTTASISRCFRRNFSRRSFFGLPEYGLLAFALTPPLRRHSDPEDRQPRVRASPYNPEDPAMLSHYPFTPKLTRLGVAACGLAALAACGDNPISGPTLDPNLSRVAGFSQLKAALVEARNEANGGFNLEMWAAVVDRNGLVVAVVFTGATSTDQWPGSRVIAAQKANTANEFMVGKRIGGTNVFGGGVALYNDHGTLIGGLGVSGDASCADHNIAWKMRYNLQLDHVPAGVADGGKDDNIIYDYVSGVSTSGFGHPECSDAATTIGKALPTTHPIGH